MMKCKRFFNVVIKNLPFLFMWHIGDVFAASTASQGMPWETPMQLIADSLTGPVAFCISVIGMTGSGFALIFGSEIGTFLKVIIYIILASSIAICAASLLRLLFGVGAELIQLL